MGSICQLGADIKRWENVSSSKKNEERFAENVGRECRKEMGRKETRIVAELLPK